MKPKITTIDQMKVVGLVCNTTLKNNQIPALWEKFIKRMKEVKNKINCPRSYGVCLSETIKEVKDFSEDSKYQYMACVEVDNFNDVPKGMITRVIPKGKYAVFTHKGDLANLRHTYDYIYGTWANKTKFKLDSRDDFELYDERFDRDNIEKSEFDIYIPIKGL